MPAPEKWSAFFELVVDQGLKKQRQRQQGSGALGIDDDGGIPRGGLHGVEAEIAPVVSADKKGVADKDTADAAHEDIEQAVQAGDR